MDKLPKELTDNALRRDTSIHQESATENLEEENTVKGIVLGESLCPLWNRYQACRERISLSRDFKTTKQATCQPPNPFFCIFIFPFFYKRERQKGGEKEKER